MDKGREKKISIKTKQIKTGKLEEKREYFIYFRCASYNPCMISLYHNYITTFFTGPRERYLTKRTTTNEMFFFFFFTVGYGILLEPLTAFVIGIFIYFFRLLKSF